MSTCKFVSVSFNHDGMEECDPESETTEILYHYENTLRFNLKQGDLVLVQTKYGLGSAYVRGLDLTEEGVCKAMKTPQLGALKSIVAKIDQSLCTSFEKKETRRKEIMSLIKKAKDLRDTAELLELLDILVPEIQVRIEKYVELCEIAGAMKE